MPLALMGHIVVDLDALTFWKPDSGSEEEQQLLVCIDLQ